MHRFSIIVPIIGDDRLFDATLASVLRYRPDSTQIIVVHDGTYEDPYHLDDEIEFVSTDQRCQLTGLLESALSKSTGEFVAVIRPGIELSQDWNVSVESAFEDTEVGSVSPIMVTPQQPSKVVSAGIKRGWGFRRSHVGTGKRTAPATLKKLTPIGPSLWAAFYRRSALEQIGNFTPDRLDSVFLDLEIAISLDTLGYENKPCSDCVVSVERSLLVTQESSQPHGRSSQRAYRRHPDSSGSGSSISQSMGIFLAELITAPLSPGRFQHAMQRLGAWRFARVDRAFAEQLAENTQAKWLQDELGELTTETPNYSQPRHTAQRQAA